MCRIHLNSKTGLKLVGLKLKRLGEILALATETEAALKDHEKEKGGRRSGEYNSSSYSLLIKKTSQVIRRGVRYGHGAKPSRCP